MVKRAHPVMIISNLRRVLYLIIIPVLRGFITALQGGFTSWVQGAWLDILILAFMILVAVLTWRRTTFSFGESHIEVKSGLFVKSSTILDWKHITTISCIYKFYSKPFRAAQLRADTIGGSFRSPDIKMWLKYDDAKQITDYYNSLCTQEAPSRSFEPSTMQMLAFSFFNTNSLAGIVFVATFISQSGKLLGSGFSNMIIGSFEEATRKFAIGIPPAAAAIAYILLVGWLIGFALVAIKYHMFTLKFAGGKFLIQSGYFTTRKYTVDSKHINFIDIRQTLFTRMLKLQSMYISAIGYGKDKDDISCVIPPVNNKIFAYQRERFFSQYKDSARKLKPPPKSAWAFIYPAVCILAMLLIILVAGAYLFPQWAAFIIFVSIMLTIPTVWFLIIRVIDYKLNGIGISGSYLTINYSSKFDLHSIVIPVKNIVKVKIRQGLVQRFWGNCSVSIYTPAESESRHYCRNVSYKEAIAFFDKIQIKNLLS